MPQSLFVNEIYRSIQGESTWAGLPCVFVRLTGCHMRCHYCDTEYAYHEGTRRTVAEEFEDAHGYDTKLIEVTGGEPLLQPGVHPLMTRLCDAGHTVLLETGGGCDISACDSRVIRILDIKTPGSGESQRNIWSNLAHLTPRDEVKLVICDRADYEWARDVIDQHRLVERTRSVLMSPVGAMPAGLEIAGVAGLEPSDLAAWILDDGLDVRMQVQLHRVVWGPTVRGV